MGLIREDPFSAATACAAMSLGLLAIACPAAAPAPGGRAPRPDPRDGRIPASYEECVARGGVREAVGRGGRCFAAFGKRADVAAYLHCRDAGGIAGAVGPRAAAVEGESHVCTLVFEPGTRE